MDIESLNNYFFTKCIFRYERGYIKLNKDNTFTFKSFVNAKEEKVDLTNIEIEYKNKWQKAKASKFSSYNYVKARKVIGKEGSFIMIPNDSFTLKGQKVVQGHVLLFVGNELREYTSKKLLVKECEIIELPNLQQGVQEFKQGNRENNIISNVQISSSFNNNESPIYPTNNNIEHEQPKETNTVQKSWKIDKPGDYINNTLILTQKLYSETSQGGTVFWGYEVTNVLSQDVKQLPEKEVKELARQKKLKNAKLVEKNGNSFLQGINCSLDDLEESYIN